MFAWKTRTGLKRFGDAYDVSTRIDGALAMRENPRLRVACLGLWILAICCGLTLAAAGTAWAAGEPTTYTAVESTAQTPASNFSASGGGDGWAVALSTSGGVNNEGQVFNVFHHQDQMTVACHNQADGSQCWPTLTETITDGSGNNFATSGHPGMYLDQGTGKLYVFGTRTSDDTGGVVCIDTTQGATNPDPFCGFTALTAVGDASNPGLSNLSMPMQVGSDLYSFNYYDGGTAGGGSGTQNRLLCFDLNTFAACSGQPYAVTLGGTTVDSGGFPEPAVATIAGKILIPINVDGNYKIACYDPSIGGNCAGSWPIADPGSDAGNDGSPFPLLDSSGNTTGFCEPTGTDACFNFDGSSATTPANLGSVTGASSPWNGPGLVIGSRVYVPNGNLLGEQGEVTCYDYAAQASCNNFPKSFGGSLDYLYTVNADPQRPTCVWVNADNGSSQIQNFDAFTGGSCSAGSPTEQIAQFVNPGSQCTPSSYGDLTILSPSNASGSVSIEDADGNQIASRSIGANGVVSLAGLNLSTSDLFVINLNQSAPTVQLQLTWTAPYNPSCLDDDATATNGQITASGGFTLTGTAGQQVSGTVATFKDPDPTGTASEYAATISWGDGSTSSGTISGTASKFTVTGSHTYSKSGSYKITVTITDTDASSNNATVSSTANIKAKQAVKAARVSAKLARVPSACVSNAFTARVQGTRIASVRFTLDGRRMSSTTVKRHQKYSGRIRVTPGHHTLTVKITFLRGSAARYRTFHRSVTGCTPAPSFTG